MILSTAFSRWTKHESLSQYFQHGGPCGTLLVTQLALLSKKIAFEAIKISVSVCMGL